jgi:hypothetical protein
MKQAYESTTDRAKAIRTELKQAHGLTGRDVSVRSEYFSMGSSINIRVKATEKGNKLSLKWLSKIAREHESISRCEITNEILSGGNRYVSVTRESEGEKAVGDPYLEATRQAMAEVSETSIVPISKSCGIGRMHAGAYRIWGPNHGGMMVTTVECAAHTVGEMELDFSAGFEQ